MHDKIEFTMTTQEALEVSLLALIQWRTALYRDENKTITRLPWHISNNVILFRETVERIEQAQEVITAMADLMAGQDK